MLSPKLIIIPAAVGFLLSFIVSLISRASFLVALLRGGVFLLVFGALSALIQFLIGRFIPELLEEERMESYPQEDLNTGNVVDITVGDSSSETPEPYNGVAERAGEAVESTENVPPVQNESSVVASKDSDVLEDFPDIGTFDSVKVTESGSEPVPESVPDSTSFTGGSSTASNPEAINMARAIQTILAKDN